MAAMTLQMQMRRDPRSQWAAREDEDATILLTSG